MGRQKRKMHVREGRRHFLLFSRKRFKHHWTSNLYKIDSLPEVINKFDPGTALSVSKGGEARQEILASSNLPCLRQIQTILSPRYKNTLVSHPIFLFIQRVNVKCSSRISLYRSSYRGWKMVTALTKQIVMMFTVVWIHLDSPKLRGTLRPPHPIHCLKHRLSR